MPRNEKKTLGCFREAYIVMKWLSSIFVQFQMF